MINKLFSIIEKDDRFRLLKLLGGILFLGVIETLSIISVLPFVTQLIAPESESEIPIVRYIVDISDYLSSDNALVIFGSFLIAFFILANILSAFITWWTNRFVYEMGHRISINLMKNYFSFPYIYFLDNNSSEISKNIIIEVRRVVNGIILPILTMLTKGVISVFVILVLVFAEPMLTAFITVVFGVGYLTVYYSLRKKLKEVGEATTTSNTGRFQMAYEALHSIEHIKISGRSETFIDRFSTPSLINARYAALGRVFELLPRYLMEVVALMLMVSYVFVSITDGASLQEVLPVLTLFLVASYRLLPSIQVIYQSFTRIRYNSDGLYTLTKNLMEDSRSGIASSIEKEYSFDQDITFRDVTYRYPSSDDDVISRINIRIRQSSVVGLIGKTGSGKSTFVNVLLGLLKFDSGSISIDGESFDSIVPSSWSKILGYVPQTIYLIDDSIRRNIAFGIPDNEINDRAVIDAAKMAAVHDFIETLPFGYETLVGENGSHLSGGQKQRVGLARAFYHSPRLLIFDEATNALDEETESVVLDSVKRLKGDITMLVVTHRLPTLDFCDEIYRFENGKSKKISFDEVGDS